MTRVALRVISAARVAAVTTTAAAVLGMAVGTGTPSAKLTSTTALILGATGNPTPNEAYLDSAINNYIRPALGDDDYRAIAVYTPEEGLGVLPNETMSIAQSTQAGVPYLQAAIAAHQGDKIIVFGYSQSGAMSAMVKNQLTAYAEAHPDEPVPDVTFVYIGGGTRPNGAIEYRQGSRYDTGLDTHPRVDTPFRSIDVAMQYDFSSDWPTYPINLVADLNVLLGALYVHNSYQPLPKQLSHFDLPTGAPPPSLEGLTGVQAPDSDTTYYFIPSVHLPLFGPLRSLGVPQKLIDIVEPLARVIVEWGYNRTIPPWQPTSFQLIPRINPVAAAGDVLTAIAQGAANALKLIPHPATTRTKPTLASPNQDTAPALISEITATSAATSQRAPGKGADQPATSPSTVAAASTVDFDSAAPTTNTAADRPSITKVDVQKPVSLNDSVSPAAELASPATISTATASDTAQAGGHHTVADGGEHPHGRVDRAAKDAPSQNIPRVPRHLTRPGSGTADASAIADTSSAPKAAGRGTYRVAGERNGVRSRQQQASGAVNHASPSSSTDSPGSTPDY